MLQKIAKHYSQMSFYQQGNINLNGNKLKER
nr:MAG TPA: hypothetical protein [Caudoviricetes sp.]DAQ87260.1 MAG TPA: hypothetical protein [Caudoviricetes sp.]